MANQRTREQEVLEAAVDLVNGGLDMEEALGCYRTISRYVLKNELDEASRDCRPYPSDEELHQLFKEMVADIKWPLPADYVPVAVQYAKKVLELYG